MQSAHVAHCRFGRHVVEKGTLQPGSQRKCYWRTRVDPFADVWDSEILPLLKKNHKLTPEGRVTRYPDHDTTGNPLTIEDGRHYQKHFEYDAAGNLRFVRDHNSELLVENRYDAAGRRSSVINALLKEFKFRYDTNGRLLETEDPYGNKRLTKYNSSGKVILTEDEEHQKIRREYDEFNRLAKVIDGAGNEIRYEYLKNNRG